VSRKNPFLVLGLMALMAVGLAACGEDETPSASGQGYEILPSDRTLGNPKSKVVLIEYAAHSCPACAAFNEQNFPRLKANYIDNGKIFYVFRLFPLRADDGAAEKIARCLPEDKYFTFVDLLFRNQPKWDVEYGVPSGEGVRAGLVLLGRIAGMSEQQVDQCMVNKAEDDRINKVASDAESRYGITGTPTFILNGVSQGSGNIPYDRLAKLLDDELAKQK
jgi:protein-disulfide isomerase